MSVHYYSMKPTFYNVWSKEAEFFDSTRDLWRTKLGECAPRFRRSVEEHGICIPVVIEITDTLPVRHRLVEGHHRWALAIALGIDVPYVLLSDLPVGTHPWHLSRGYAFPWADGNIA